MKVCLFSMPEQVFSPPSSLPPHLPPLPPLPPLPHLPPLPSLFHLPPLPSLPPLPPLCLNKCSDRGPTHFSHNTKSLLFYQINNKKKDERFVPLFPVPFTPFR